MAAFAPQQQVPNLGPSTQAAGGPLPAFNEPELDIGLRQLQEHCFKVYPDHALNPICVRPPKSFVREGGTEPLDYIYIFANGGDPARRIPPHWHYVGLGLTDIHGYAFLWSLCQNYGESNKFPQLYPAYDPIKCESGYGFELTLRLRRDDNTSQPPEWPCRIMQALAQYVFQSKNVFKVGDHTKWYKPLDGESSIIQHMLMTLDPQLQETRTFRGNVRFIQLVGVCTDELQAARKWTGNGILNLMKEREETGGDYLVTDMRRGASIFEIDSIYLDHVNEAINNYGSDMCLLSTLHKFRAHKPKWFEQAELAHPRGTEETCDGSDIDDIDDGVRAMLSREQEQNSPLVTSCADENIDAHEDMSQDYINSANRNPSRMSHESESSAMLDIRNAETAKMRIYDSLYLLIPKEAAKVLPFALKHRLAYGRPFHYQSFRGDLLTSFVPERCAIAHMVSKEMPYVRQGIMLQLYIPDELRLQMYELISADFNDDHSDRPVRLPKNYSWPEHKLHITITDAIRDSDESEMTT